MASTLTPRDIPRLRLLSHGLLPAPEGFPRPAFHAPEDVVGWMTAVQGQDWYSVPWSIGARVGSTSPTPSVKESPSAT